MLKGKISYYFFLIISLAACTPNPTSSVVHQAYPDVKIASAMKNVMWKGELAGKINLDTISEKEGLYGLGPLAFLRGEIMLKDGKSYISKVVDDSTMVVKQNFVATAPFLVYSNVKEWKEISLPTKVKSIKDLEEFVDERTKKYKRPFAFKLVGKVNNALIHIQNLAPGTKVSSPKEAHSGQVKYPLGKEEVEIVGFFSTEHQGVFTHHDTYLHLHLITKDETKMGHLDEVEMGAMRLFLPVR